MRRRVYRVMPDGESWAVRWEGVSLWRHRTKEAAIDNAVRTAKENEPSQAVVHNADGKMETEWTYGADPHPPGG